MLLGMLSVAYQVLISLIQIQELLLENNLLHSKHITLIVIIIITVQ